MHKDLRTAVDKIKGLLADKTSELNSGKLDLGQYNQFCQLATATLKVIYALDETMLLENK